MLCRLKDCRMHLGKASAKGRELTEHRGRSVNSGEALVGSGETTLRALGFVLGRHQQTGRDQRRVFHAAATARGVRRRVLPCPSTLPMAMARRPLMEVTMCGSGVGQWRIRGRERRSTEAERRRSRRRINRATAEIEHCGPRAASNLCCSERPMQIRRKARTGSCRALRRSSQRADHQRRTRRASSRATPWRGRMPGSP